MLILQIETATAVCSVALSQNGKTIGQVEIDSPNVHASKLTRLIEQVMGECSLPLNQLDAVAVSKGPGSYTGLRIGVSTAKGLCYALDKPLIAIDSLHALASGFVYKNTGLPEESLLYPMIDARRLEVYTAVFNTRGDILKKTSAQVLDADFFTGCNEEGPFILFGDGADKFKEIFSDDKRILIVPQFRPSAAHLTLLASKSFSSSNFEDNAYFEPFYLKDFIPLQPKKK